MQSDAPLIVVENLTIAYPGQPPALEEVSFTLHGGSICGLVGVNGAGKSTLFKALMGLVRVQRGTIRLAGLSVEQALRRNGVAYVPQSEDIDWSFPVRVKDVVLMGRYGHMNFLRLPRPADHAAVQAALARMDLLALAERPIGALSGGQRKRVFLARALAQDARIILLDEPFTGVDVQTETALLALMQNLRAEGRLMLVSTHNLGSVPDYCSEVILLNRRIIAAGPTAQTFTADNLTRTFGGMLRHLHLGGDALHDDADPRRVTVLTDDERPLVLYGSKGTEAIVPRPDTPPTPAKDAP